MSARFSPCILTIERRRRKKHDFRKKAKRIFAAKMKITPFSHPKSVDPRLGCAKPVSGADSFRTAFAVFSISAKRKKKKKISRHLKTTPPTHLMKRGRSGVVPRVRFSQPVSSSLGRSESKTPMLILFS